MSDLIFNTELHEYRVDGRIIPSVTHVIETIQTWRGIPVDVLEHARIRGARVDAAVNVYDDSLYSGPPIFDVIADETVPYLLAWKRFREDTKCRVLASQISGHNQVYGYAGTLDKICVLGDRSDGGALIDIKATALIEPETSLQTAAYSHMGISSIYSGAKRFTLQLKPDATYRLHEWKDPSDFPTFLAALTLTNWAARNRK